MSLFATTEPIGEGPGPVYGRGQLWLAWGLGFGLAADTFMLLGHNRQAIAIVPSLKLVILRMGSTPEDAVYNVADYCMPSSSRAFTTRAAPNFPRPNAAVQ